MQWNDTCWIVFGVFVAVLWLHPLYLWYNHTFYYLRLTLMDSVEQQQIDFEASDCP